MRTKTLLLSAAAVAAGIISASAQVYSVNIVGYVNTTVTGGGQFNLLANPLDDGTNTVTSLGATYPVKTQIQKWNTLAASYQTATKSTSTSWTTNLSLPPGTGFFVKQPASGVLLTNTFVGQLVNSLGSVVKTNTQVIVAGFSLIGSPVPYAGTLTDAAPNTLALGPALAIKAQVQAWNTPAQSFITATKSTSTSWTTNLAISVAQGFFVNAKGASNWVQTLP